MARRRLPEFQEQRQTPGSEHAEGLSPTQRGARPPPSKPAVTTKPQFPQALVPQNVLGVHDVRPVGARDVLLSPFVDGPTSGLVLRRIRDLADATPSGVNNSGAVTVPEGYILLLRAVVSTILNTNVDNSGAINFPQDAMLYGALFVNDSGIDESPDVLVFEQNFVTDPMTGRRYRKYHSPRFSVLDQNSSLTYQVTRQEPIFAAGFGGNPAQMPISYYATQFSGTLILRRPNLALLDQVASESLLVSPRA